MAVGDIITFEYEEDECKSKCKSKRTVQQAKVLSVHNFTFEVEGPGYFNTYYYRLTKVIKWHTKKSEKNQKNQKKSPEWEYNILLILNNKPTKPCYQCRGKTIFRGCENCGHIAL